MQLFINLFFLYAGIISTLLYSNPCDLLPVLPALAPPAMPALALSRGSCAFPCGHGSDHNASGRLLQSRLADISGLARWEMEGDGRKNLLEYC